MHRHVRFRRPDPGTAKDDRHGAGSQGRGDRARLRHAAAPVPRPPRRDPQHPQADGRRDARRPGQHHAADHGPRLGVRHDRQDAGAAGHLRVPQPQGPHVRRAFYRALRFYQGADRVGQAGGAGQAVAPDRRAARVPAAESVPRLARRVLPDAAVGRALRVPPGARGGDRRGARRTRQLHLRHPELPRAGHGVRPGAGLQDDGAAVRRGASAGEEQAVGLLHDGRDGAGSAPSRVLAVLRPAPSALSTGQRVRDRVPGLLPVPGSRGRLAPGGPARGRDHDRDVATTARAR